MLRGNIVFGLVVSVFSTALLYYLYRQSAADAQQADANIWPLRVAVGLLLLGLMIVAEYAWRLYSSRSDTTAPPAEARRNTFLMVAIVLLSIAYIASLRTVGYLVATYLFLLISFYVLGVKEKIKLFGLPLAMVTIYTVGFSMLLYIPLPRGTGIFRTISDVVR